jgi:hypothetical protein
VFNPPTSKSFLKFDANTYVDVKANPDSLPIVRVQDSSSAIQVQSTFVAATAGNFPLSAEGNLSAGSGGGGGGALHWSAKVGNGKFDLIVHDAFDGDGVGSAKRDGPEISEEKEETRGAFGVANLNDTDSDTTADTSDTAIANEKDMIKVIIKKVTDATIDGNVTLELTGDGTKVQLWKAESKEGGVETARSWACSALPKTFWIEGLVKSASVREIIVTLKKSGAGGGFADGAELDKAKLTFVWAEVGQNAVEHSTKAAADLWILDMWKNITTPPKDRITLYGGTGLRPVANFGVRNCILFKYTVYPADVWKEPGVKFDLARQKERKAWAGMGQSPNIQWTPLLPNAAFPANDEESNDDPFEGDESDCPNNNNEMFVEDVPGINNPNAGSDHYVYRGNYWEYMRVRFDGIDPVGDGIKGSRCSAKYDWHARHWLVKDAQTGKWKRDSGDAQETETNDIAPVHKPLPANNP